MGWVSLPSPRTQASNLFVTLAPRVGPTRLHMTTPQSQLGWEPPRVWRTPSGPKHVNPHPQIELWVILSGQKRVLAAT